MLKKGSLVKHKLFAMTGIVLKEPVDGFVVVYWQKNSKIIGLTEKHKKE